MSALPPKADIQRVVLECLLLTQSGHSMSYVVQQAGIWFVDLIIRTDGGNVSLQMTADSLEKLKTIKQEEEID